jgi:hypothetical protein
VANDDALPEKGASAAAKEAPKKDIDDDTNDANSNFEPRNGSWVAELEDARETLAEALVTKPITPASASEGKSKGKKKGKGKGTGEGGEGDFGGTTELLDSYVRVCRAYRMLRQWERLMGNAKKGLAQCASTPSAQHESEFRKYKKQASAVLAVPSGLKATGHVASRTFDRSEERVGPFDDIDTSGAQSAFRDGLHQKVIVEGVVPDLCLNNDTIFGNSNMFQDACLQGDVRLMEEMVALGVAIDRHFREVPPGADILRCEGVVPYKASGLVMACLTLAAADSTGKKWAAARNGLPKKKDVLDRIEEIATQLVHLGADLNRKLVLDGEINRLWNLRECTARRPSRSPPCPSARL